MEDATDYTCRFTYSGTTATSNTATISVIGFLSWPSYTVVESGSNTTITCVLQSNSFTTYIRALVDFTEEIGIQIGESVMVEADSSDYTATWTITSVSANDTGNYYCDGGLYSDNVLIANATSPTSAIIVPGVNVDPDDARVEAGKAATFTCEARCSGAAIATWYLALCIHNAGFPSHKLVTMLVAMVSIAVDTVEVTVTMDLSYADASYSQKSEISKPFMIFLAHVIKRSSGWMPFGHPPGHWVGKKFHQTDTYNSSEYKMQSTLAISDAAFSDIGDYSCVIGDTATADNTIRRVTTTEANLQVRVITMSNTLVEEGDAVTLVCSVPDDVTSLTMEIKNSTDQSVVAGGSVTTVTSCLGLLFVGNTTTNIFRLTTLGSFKTVSVVWDDISLADGMDYTCEAVYASKTYTRESTLTVVGPSYEIRTNLVGTDKEVTFYYCADVDNRALVLTATFTDSSSNTVDLVTPLEFDFFSMAISVDEDRVESGDDISLSCSTSDLDLGYPTYAWGRELGQCNACEAAINATLLTIAGSWTAFQARVQISLNSRRTLCLKGLKKRTLYLIKIKLDIENEILSELEISAVRPETRVCCTSILSPVWWIWRQNVPGDSMSKKSTQGGLFI
eukprot:sb/3479441/